MSSDVKLEEWNISGIQVGERTKHYSFEDRDYSQVRVEIQLVRNYSYYLSKILMILVFIVACSWIVFFLPPDDLAGRTGISVTLFLAAITFSFVIGTNLPKISYQTYIDQYLFMNYLYIVISIVLNLVISETHKVNSEKAIRLNENCQWMFPLSYSIYSTWWLITSISTQSRSQRNR